jgi:hypothetical protein
MTRGHRTEASAPKRPGPLARACAWCMPLARRTGHVTFVPVAQMAHRCRVHGPAPPGRSGRVCQPIPTDLRRSRPLIGHRPCVPTKGAHPHSHPWYRRMSVTQARPGDTHPAPCLLLTCSLVGGRPAVLWCLVAPKHAAVGGRAVLSSDGQPLRAALMPAGQHGGDQRHLLVVQTMAAGHTAQEGTMTMGETPC